MVVGPLAARLLAARAATAVGARAGAAATTRASISEMQTALSVLEKETTIVIPVDSTAIASIAWAPEDQLIIVVFHRGGTYSYPGDEVLFGEFALASSKGQFFNKNIRSRG